MKRQESPHSTVSGTSYYLMLADVHCPLVQIKRSEGELFVIISSLLKPLGTKTKAKMRTLKSAPQICLAAAVQLRALLCLNTKKERH